MLAAQGVVKPCHSLKGLFTDFTYIGVPEIVSSSEIRFILSILHFFGHCGRYGRIYGDTDRSIRDVTVTGGPFRTPMVAATGIE